MNGTLGAMPPPDFAWQVGKTASSIKFVTDAERYIANCTDADQIARLRTVIQEVKEGKKVLDDWLTAQEFLTKKDDSN